MCVYEVRNSEMIDTEEQPDRERQAGIQSQRKARQVERKRWKAHRRGCHVFRKCMLKYYFISGKVNNVNLWSSGYFKVLFEDVCSLH